MSRRAKDSGEPLYLSIDDTVVRKKCHSSCAKHPAVSVTKSVFMGVAAVCRAVVGVLTSCRVALYCTAPADCRLPYLGPAVMAAVTQCRGRQQKRGQQRRNPSGNPSCMSHNLSLLPNKGRTLLKAYALPKYKGMLYFLQKNKKRENFSNNSCKNSLPERGVYCFLIISNLLSLF